MDPLVELEIIIKECDEILIKEGIIPTTFYSKIINIILRNNWMSYIFKFFTYYYRNS